MTLFLLVALSHAGDVDLVTIAGSDGLPAAGEALQQLVAEAKNEKKLLKALDSARLGDVALPAKAGFGADLVLSEVSPMTRCTWTGSLTCIVSARTTSKVEPGEFDAFCKSKYGATAEIQTHLSSSSDSGATWTIEGAEKCWALNGATVQILPTAHDDLEGVGMGDDEFIAPELTGLTKDQVDATIAKQTNAFKACAIREDGPSAAGKLVVAFHIAQDGTLDRVDAKSSTLTDDEAETCILNRFRRIQFVPPNDGYTEGTYEFRF